MRVWSKFNLRSDVTKAQMNITLRNSKKHLKVSFTNHQIFGKLGKKQATIIVQCNHWIFSCLTIIAGFNPVSTGRRKRVFFFLHAAWRLSVCLIRPAFAFAGRMKRSLPAFFKPRCNSSNSISSIERQLPLACRDGRPSLLLGLLWREWTREKGYVTREGLKLLCRREGKEEEGLFLSACEAITFLEKRHCQT